MLLIIKHVTIQSIAWHLSKRQTTSLLVYLHIFHINSTLIYLFSRHVRLEFNNCLYLHNFLVSTYQRQSYMYMSWNISFSYRFFISIYQSFHYINISCTIISIYFMYIYSGKVSIKLNINYIPCTYSYFVYLSS